MLLFLIGCLPFASLFGLVISLERMFEEIRRIHGGDGGEWKALLAEVVELLLLSELEFDIAAFWFAGA